MPGILASSWAATGVALACVFKFKSKEKKTLTFGYVITWFLGGVGEPLLYGLNVPYKTPFVAGVISGAITGLVAGILNLTGHVLNISNGIYGFSGICWRQYVQLYRIRSNCRSWLDFWFCCNAVL